MSSEGLVSQVREREGRARLLAPQFSRQQPHTHAPSLPLLSRHLPSQALTRPLPSSPAGNRWATAPSPSPGWDRWRWWWRRRSPAGGRQTRPVARRPPPGEGAGGRGARGWASLHSQPPPGPFSGPAGRRRSAGRPAEVGEAPTPFFFPVRSVTRKAVVRRLFRCTRRCVLEEPGAQRGGVCGGGGRQAGRGGGPRVFFFLLGSAICEWSEFFFFLSPLTSLSAFSPPWCVLSASLRMLPHPQREREGTRARPPALPPRAGDWRAAAGTRLSPSERGRAPPPRSGVAGTLGPAEPPPRPASCPPTPTRKRAPGLGGAIPVGGPGGNAACAPQGQGRAGARRRRRPPPRALSDPLSCTPHRALLTPLSPTRPTPQSHTGLPHQARHRHEGHRPDRLPWPGTEKERGRRERAGGRRAAAAHGVCVLASPAGAPRSPGPVPGVSAALTSHLPCGRERGAGERGRPRRTKCCPRGPTRSVAP
jgi:hypothetical protein